jgi:Family of unknown function (DUF5522)
MFVYDSNTNVKGYVFMSSQEQEVDWEITEQGLYIATRGFLIRRGYCCANRCRNCPYINWQLQSTWQPGPEKYVKRIRGVPKAMAGACAMLHFHEEQLDLAASTQQAYHREMIEHYRVLLERWGSNIT